MKSLLIVGAGSFSTEVEEIARFNGYDNIAFADDNLDAIYSSPIVGRMDELDKLHHQFDEAIVALGNNEDRIKYHTILKELKYRIPVLIHPHAFVSKDSTIGIGSIIRANAVIGRYVNVGESCIINLGAMIDHHCVIGKGVHLLIGAIVRNQKTVAPMKWISSNSVIE